MSNLEDSKPVQGLRVRTSREFKLKPKDGKNVQVFHLKDFNFTPETLILQCVKQNWFTVSAILTEEEILKEDKRLSKLVKKDGKKRKTDKI